MARWACIFAPLVALAGCAGVQPSTARTLSSLPDDPEERREQLDSADARPGPERRKPLSPRLQKVERAAATLAAFVGTLLSTSDNASLGAAVMFDEGLLFDRAQRRRHGRGADGDDEGDDDARDGDEYDASRLVPWVRLANPPDGSHRPERPSHGDPAGGESTDAPRPAHD